jgi:hypothetical protein
MPVTHLPQALNRERTGVHTLHNCEEINRNNAWNPFKNGGTACGTAGRRLACFLPALMNK